MVMFPSISFAGLAAADVAGAAGVDAAATDVTGGATAGWPLEHPATAAATASTAKAVAVLTQS
jgi:hypothetical protein